LFEQGFSVCFVWGVMFFGCFFGFFLVFVLGVLGGRCCLVGLACAGWFIWLVGVVFELCVGFRDGLGC